MRLGDYIVTYSGAKFYPLDPHVADIHIHDIAHSLAMQCRFNGHTVKFYSVAEHCIHLSRWVPEQYALWALLHDASEAYLCDVPSPIKPMLVGYAGIETNVLEAIAKRFDLDGDTIPEPVKRADKRIVVDEATRLLINSGWTKEIDPLGIKIQCWSPNQAKAEFLARFEQLNSGR